MNILGKTLAALGAIVLTATAVALPEVCHISVPANAAANPSVASTDTPHSHYIARFLAADRQ